VRKKATTCTVCRHPERERIEALRASGASLESLARKFKVHKDAVWRHWRDHVSADLKTSYLAGPATIAELRERAAKEGGSILDHLSILRSILMGAITASAEAQSAFTLAALSGRLVEVLKEIGRLTGEIERLNPSISVTTNIALMSDPQMIRLQAGLLTIARQHPAARADIVALLRGLDAKPEGPKPNGAPHHPPMIEGEILGYKAPQ
jgi:transposase-like protein